MPPSLTYQHERKSISIYFILNDFTAPAWACFPFLLQVDNESIPNDCMAKGKTIEKWNTKTRNSWMNWNGSCCWRRNITGRRELLLKAAVEKGSWTEDARTCWSTLRRRRRRRWWWWGGNVISHLLPIIIRWRQKRASKTRASERVEFI